MKVCVKCGTRKRITSFYVHRKMADGHLNECKACVKKRVAQHRSENLDYIQAYDRERGLLAHRKAAVKKRAKRYKKEQAFLVKLRRQRMPETMAAYNAVARAKRAGVIVPEPCKRCGATKKVQGHHSDYFDKLNVTWFCPKCHGAEHRKMNERERA